MAEYIEKNKVVELLNEFKRGDVIPHVEDYSKGWNDALEQIESCVAEDIPAVDVRPERHGEWVDIGAGYVACSECGEEHGWENYRATYCDTCGAKMDGKDV